MNNKLKKFYETINAFPNVQVQYFHDGRKIIALKRMLTMPYINLGTDVDCFLNPGHIEYINGYKGVQICSLADLSTIKGLSTYKNALFYKYWNRLFYRLILPKLSRIVTISDYTQKDLIDFYPQLRSKIVRIYNGISPFWTDDVYSMDSVIKLNINFPYFIWWGFVSRRKNIYNLIKAYKLAKKVQHQLPKLLLVGNIADYMIDIRNKFDEDVINIPFQDDYILKSLVRQSQGLIFPSLYEGFGLPVIEAYSQGVNVACSNVTSLPEISGGYAILFNPNDLDDIKRAIIELSQKPFQSDTLKRYAINFTYEHAAMEYMNLINSLVK